LIQRLNNTCQNTSVKKWLEENWFDLVSISAKVLTISGIVLFGLCLAVYYVWKIETLPGVKIAVILFFIGRILSILRGLR